MSLTNWKKLSEKTEKVGHKIITHKFYRMPNGVETDFTIFGRTGEHVVATIALTKDNQVIIARQYRPGPERILDELPGGGVENGEDLAVAAARELREETGYKTDEPLLHIGSSCRDAYVNHNSDYYLALNCTLDHSQQLDEADEYVEVTLISIEQLIENAKTGNMSDASAVLMAYEKLLELRNTDTRKNS